PRTINYVETHGTASPIGDGIEIDGIKSGYQAALPVDAPTVTQAPCYLSSLKPCIGHSEVASGMAALIKVINALNHDCIPGLPGFEQLNPNVSLSGSVFKINSNNQPWPQNLDLEGNPLPRRAAINSYGFSVNAHVVLEQYQPAEVEVKDEVNSSEPGWHTLVLSAKNEDRLQALCQNLAQFLANNRAISLANLAYTLQVGRSALNKRMAIVVDTVDQLHLILASPPKVSNDVLISSDSNTAKTLSDEQPWFKRLCQSANHTQPDCQQLARAFVTGESVNWPLLARSTVTHSIELPTYPFLHTPLWHKARHKNNRCKQMKQQLQASGKKRICVIGAGPAGLVMAKSLLEEGHTPVIFESMDQLGGIWYMAEGKTAGVYQGTRFQNAKDTSFFSDFFPETDNTFLTAAQVNEYLHQYADKFSLKGLIHYDHKVKAVTETDNGQWSVTIVNRGEQTDDNREFTEVFDGVALCHGRYRTPKTPAIEGLDSFEGKITHSGAYVDNQAFASKRVMVIGNGVSGMDIAEEASKNAAAVYWHRRAKRLILPRMVGV
ncbi:MAG: NAD(P)-binding domain-containing protein, partial [Algicola sp.]|nr:NAD(P)-binding domain-containing protein [Algicola sp.]